MNTRRTAGEVAGARLPIGDLLSLVGLIAVAVVSLTLLTGNLPLGAGGGDGGGDGGGGGAFRTPTPSNVVIVDPRADVPGTIVYVKAGNIWLQHGEKAVALTDGGRDAMPSFTADGQWIYFIRTADELGRWTVGGVFARYLLDMPTLMRVPADGSGPA